MAGIRVEALRRGVRTRHRPALAGHTDPRPSLDARHPPLLDYHSVDKDVKKIVRQALREYGVYPAAHENPWRPAESRRLASIKQLVWKMYFL